ncbi:MAG: hypothetical protein KGI54_10770 [Pseudomonadota bacterium]|nr:hypothetical protein [Pseudomonadota bacterium]
MLTHTEIEQYAHDYNLDLNNIHQALEFIDNENIPLDWIELLSTVDPNGNFIPDAPLSMAYVIGLAAALDTGTLSREDIETAYLAILRKMQ